MMSTRFYICKALTHYCPVFRFYTPWTVRCPLFIPPGSVKGYKKRTPDSKWSNNKKYYGNIAQFYEKTQKK